LEPARFAIAFTVREKFGWALASLRRIYAHFEVPFTLYFVDCGYPAMVRAEIEGFLADKSNVVRIDSGRFLLPSESLNLVVPRITEDFLYVINNDVLIEPRFGTCALQTFEQYGCALVAPETIEIQRGWREPHRAEYVSGAIVDQDGVLRVEVPQPAGAGKPEPVRRVQHFEPHALAMTRAAALALHPLPVLNTREHIDMAVHAWRLDLAVYADDRARAAYLLPPIRDYDLPYFEFRWNRQTALDSQARVQARWNVADFPDSMPFIDEWREFGTDKWVLRTYPDVCEDDDFPAVFA
jgi:hypothetical protein